MFWEYHLGECGAKEEGERVMDGREYISVQEAKAPLYSNNNLPTIIQVTVHTSIS
jgi:hypothetical protein